MFLIFGLTLVNFYAAMFIAKTETHRNKKLGLFFALATSLGVLFFYKYFNFFNEAVRDSLSLISVEYKFELLDVLLPVGISFYTFQTLSYTIDVYQKKYPYEHSLSRFALFCFIFSSASSRPY